MKDREQRRRLADDVQLVYVRSSSHPVEYAITLIAVRDGAWRTVRGYDNAHRPEEHHEHRYVGGDKQPPVVTYGPVNDAMSRAILTLLARWAEIVADWESTR